MAKDLTLDDLRVTAALSGLKLSDDELKLLLTGVNRAKKQTVELRELISLDSEPAGAFKALSK